MTAFGALLQLVERLDARTAFVTARLRLTAHPVEFGAQQVVGPIHQGILSTDAFLPLLQIVGVVALVRIERLVGQFHDAVAHAVEEVAVVRHHEERGAGVAQIVLQPLHHLEVEVVGRLVEDEELRVVGQHLGQCHTLALSARKLGDGLLQIGDFQLCEDADGLGIAIGHIAHSHGIGKRGLLAQIADVQVVAKDDRAAVGSLLPHDDVEQGGLARTVARDETHAVALAHA